MRERNTAFFALVLGLGLASLSCKAPVAQAPALDPNDKKPEIVAQDRIEPAALAALLAKSDQAAQTQVLSIGIKPLFEDGHIPGSTFIGEAGTPAGLKALEQAAKGLPKDKQTVIYCGCCPWEHCPNLLPAYKKLKELGFGDLKVLKIPNDFGTDWEKKGYPSEKSKKAKKS